MASFSRANALLISESRTLECLVVGVLVYLCGIIIYRLHFHPLSKYPGPFFAKITDWYNVYHCLSGDRHLEFHHIHQKYGDYVRFGPNRISINTSTGLKKIYGAKSNVKKSSIFEVFIKFFGHWSTQTIIDTDKHGHTKKRRVLAQALSDGSLKGKEEVILTSVRKFCSILSTPNEKEDGWSDAINIASITSFLSFDIMGSVCFGQSFDMLENHANRYVLDVVSDGAQCLNTLGHMQGILKTGMHKLLFRNLLSGLKRYKDYSREQCEHPVKDSPLSKSPSVFQSLQASIDDDTGKPLFTRGELQSESSLLIIAGSDTTSTCLAATMFYLLHNPSALSVAQKEIRQEFDNVEDIRLGPTLSGCTYLRACIKESLRLSPPVGGLMPREVLFDGLEIDGHFFPKGTELGTPHYAIHHKEAYFPDPFAFKPSRWAGSDKEERLIAESAFCAFTIGSRACVGQTMAYHELMIVLGRILYFYEMRLSEGSSLGQGGPHLSVGRQRSGEYQLYDSFASRSDGPLVHFRKRNMY